MIEVVDIPPRDLKGKGVASRESSTLMNLVDEATVMEAAKDFVHQSSRRAEQPSTAASKFPVEVPISFEGLDPRLLPEAVEESRRRVRDEDFAQWGIDLSRAFNPVPNMINSDSVLMDNSKVGCQLLESTILSRDHHLLRYCKDTTEDMVQKFRQSLVVVRTDFFVDLVICLHFLYADLLL